MRRKRVSLTAATLVTTVSLFAAMAASAQDKPNWRDGRKVFKKCEACHSFRPGETRFGPSLAGFYGRKAGTAPDFPYSKGLLAKRAEGLVWTTETLEPFLKAPKKFIEKTKMSFPGLKDPDDLRSVIAYVKRKGSRKR